MRCSQAEHLLSLHLDGRLASGQRRALSDHLADCPTCRALDHELVAARELALSLPVQRISGGFREELWQRIRAGEGSPDAVFREPVPLATKVRYFATGAAAAGLLILAAHWLRRPDAPRHPSTPAVPEAGGPLAEARPEAGKLVPRSATPAVAPVVPATPDKLAELVADGYADAVRTLHAKAQALDGQPLTADGIEKLRRQADYASRYAAMLRWLLEGEYLNLQQDDLAGLVAVETVGDQVRTQRDPDGLRKVLRPIQRMRVEPPRNFFCNPCVTDETRFVQEFLVRLRSSQLDDAVGSKIHVVTQPGVGGNQVLVFVRR
jgi:anti-sigma factor RsiW